jgi:hypothetical protein
VTGIDPDAGADRARRLRPAYQLWGGLKAVALTDIVQVALLMPGGLIIAVPHPEPDRRHGDRLWPASTADHPTSPRSST